MVQRSLSYGHSTKGSEGRSQKRVLFMSMQDVQLPQHLTVRSLPVVVDLVALLLEFERDSEPLCWIELDSRVEHLHWSPDKKSKTLVASSRQVI